MCLRVWCSLDRARGNGETNVPRLEVKHPVKGHNSSGRSFSNKLTFLWGGFCATRWESAWKTHSVKLGLSWPAFCVMSTFWCSKCTGLRLVKLKQKLGKTKVRKEKGFVCLMWDYVSFFAVPGQCSSQDVQTLGVYGYDGTGITFWNTFVCVIDGIQKQLCVFWLQLSMQVAEHNIV